MALTIGKLGGYAVYMLGPSVIGQRVRVSGKYWFFDFDQRFGPLVVDKDGEPTDAQPIGDDHPFWKPFEVWLAGYWRAAGAGELDHYLRVNGGTRPSQLSYPGRSSIQRADPK